MIATATQPQASDPAQQQSLAYFRALFDHPALDGLLFGLSGFETRPADAERDPGLHVWANSPDGAAQLAHMPPMNSLNVHARLTPVAKRPNSGRGDWTHAAAIVGFGADVDIAHAVHDL